MVPLVDLADLLIISGEVRRGIREAHCAGWQRIRDSRAEAFAGKYPRIVQKYGGEELIDAVGLVVAAEMLAASADLLKEIAINRGAGERESERGVAALLEES